MAGALVIGAASAYVAFRWIAVAAGAVVGTLVPIALSYVGLRLVDVAPGGRGLSGIGPEALWALSTAHVDFAALVLAGVLVAAALHGFAWRG